MRFLILFKKIYFEMPLISQKRQNQKPMAYEKQAL